MNYGIPKKKKKLLKKKLLRCEYQIEECLYRHFYKY